MNCIAMLLLAEAALGAIDYAQSTTTDYSRRTYRMFKIFGQDERSAEIDYSTCVWSKPFSSGAMDCETFLDGSVLVGMECTKTNCNTKRLQCCGVKGRFKKCKAIYNGFVALVDQSLNENWKGIIGSKAFGFNGISLTGAL